MNWSEFATIAMALKTSYPNFQIMPSEESKKIWFSMLQDLDYGVCQNAVKQIIATSKFPPSIAEIREKYTELTVLPVADAGEAWEEVMRAIQHYGIYGEVEALNSLSELVRQTVKRIGFRNLCLSENIVADRAHFFKIYDSIATRQRNESKIPLAVLQQKESYIQAIAKPEDVKEIVQQEEYQEVERAEVTTEYIQNLMYKYGLKRV